MSDTKDFFVFVCELCGATNPNDIIMVGAIYGYLRIIAKLYPGEAARATAKHFKQIKTEVNPNEQEKASNFKPVDP